MRQTYKVLVVDDEPNFEPPIFQRIPRNVRAGQYEFLFAQNDVEAHTRVNEGDSTMSMLSDTISLIDEHASPAHHCAGAIYPVYQLKPRQNPQS